MAEIPLISPQVMAAAKPDFESQLNLEKEATETTTQQAVTPTKVAVKGLRREAEILATTPQIPVRIR